MTTKWIKDRPEGLKSSEPCHYDRRSCTQSTKKYHCRCSARHLQMRVIEIRETSDPSRESIGKCRRIFPAYGSSSTSFLTESVLPVMYVASVHLRWKCRHLCGQRRIHCLSTFLENRSRPIGVRVCPVAQCIFSAPHLIRVSGQWLCSGGKIPHVSLS